MHLDEFWKGRVDVDMEKYNRDLEELNSILGKYITQSESKEMFDYPVFFINNNMFAGLHGEDLFVRLPDEAQLKIYIDQEEAYPFAPEGKIMKEYVVLPESLLSDKMLLELWLDISFEYVSSLPPNGSNIYEI